MSIIFCLALYQVILIIITMEIKIRNLTKEDYDDMVSIWEASGLPYKPRGRDSREEIERQMEESGDLFIGAEVNGRLVGVVIGSWDGRKGWINRIAVLPEFQGRGIAKMLVGACEDALRSRGARIFAMLIEEGNEPSFRMAERLGYKLHRDIFYLTKRDSDDV